MRLICFAFFVLSACSGGGSAAKIIDPIDELPTEITPEVNPKPTGTASYRGPMSLSFTPAQSTTVALDGTLGLTVNFDGGVDAVTGSVSGFETASGGPVSGRLFLSGGALEDRDVALLFDSQISGSLRSGTDSYLIFGQMAGEFLETNQSAVSGTLSGTARQSGRDAPLSGQFQAGRVP